MKAKKQTDRRKADAAEGGRGFCQHRFDLHHFKVGNDGRLTHYAAFDPTKDAWRWCTIGAWRNPHKDSNLEKWESVGVPAAWIGVECAGDTLEAMRSYVRAFKCRWGAFWDWTAERERMPLDCECVAELLNPYGGGWAMSGNAHAAVWFILAMLEYPRYLEFPFLHVGGALFGDPSGRIDGAGLVFQETFAHFKECIAWYGRRFGCRGEAEKVIGCAGMVYRWMCECGTIDAEAFAVLEKWFYGVRDALYEMAVAVADSYVPDEDTRRKSRFVGQKVKGAGVYKGKCARVNLSGNGVVLKDGTVCAFPPSCIFALDLLLDGFGSGKDCGYAQIKKSRWACNITQKETRDIIEQETDAKGRFTGRARFKPSAF